MMARGKQRRNIVFVILLGIVLLFFLTIFVWLQLKLQPEKLLKEKKIVMKNSMEDSTYTGDENEIYEEGTDYSANIPAFHLSKRTQAEDVSDRLERDKDFQEDSDTQEWERDAANEWESEYLCSYSSDRLLDESDIEYLKQKKTDPFPANETILQMVVNEIYAKYGYTFRNEEIQQYFENKQWYQDITIRIKEMDQVFDRMTKTEQENVKFLSAHMEE